MTVKIPLSFVKLGSPVSWRQLLWAVKREILSHDEVYSLLKNSPQYLMLQKKGCYLSEGSDSIIPALEFISENEDIKDNDLKKYWMYTSLRWVYMNRNDVDDALKMAADIYADFDYPEEMEPFIYYMPAKDGYDPSLYSLEENRERLYKLWKEFLENGV